MEKNQEEWRRIRKNGEESGRMEKNQEEWRRIKKKLDTIGVYREV
jgi:hypothetical protein